MIQYTDTNSCIKIGDLGMHLMLKDGLFSKPKVLKAMNGVTFSIERDRTIGLVGESGCGKTTVDRTILKLYQVTAGRILYQGMDVTGLSDSQMAPCRKEMQTILRDPYTSLNPRKNIGDIITEPIQATKLHTGKDKNDRVRELVEMVGLGPDHINRCPHEFSGGQRQRIGIARALTTEPEFIVCDEPVSVLDVSIQTQIISVLEELQDKFHFTCLFVSHGLSMVCHISPEVGVIYLGNLIEYAQANGLYDNMLRPYTRSLISAVPVADPKLAKENQRIILGGDVPSPINPTPGCSFRSRCHYAKGTRGRVKPELKAVSDKHKVVCHLSDQPDGTGFARIEPQGQNHGYRITGTESRVQNHVAVPVVRYSVDWAPVTHIALRGRKMLTGCP